MPFFVYHQLNCQQLTTLHLTKTTIPKTNTKRQLHFLLLLRFLLLRLLLLLLLDHGNPLLDLLSGKRLLCRMLSQNHHVHRLLRHAHCLRVTRRSVTHLQQARENERNALLLGKAFFIVCFQVGTEGSLISATRVCLFRHANTPSSPSTRSRCRQGPS